MALPRAVCGGHPRAQNRKVSLVDSKLLSADMGAGEVRLVLEVLIHVSTGRPGLDAGTLWSQAMEVRIPGGKLEQAHDGMRWLSSGSLTLDGQPLDFPDDELNARGAVRLELRGDDGALVVTGAGLSVAPRGEPRFLERFEKIEP